MEIIVKLVIQLLEEMSYMGPSSVVDWCLEQFILHYKHQLGYSFGSVLLQVISAVENAIPAINTDIMSPQSPTSDDQRRIEVDKWSKGDDYDKPHLECYPLKWNERVILDEGVNISIEKNDTSIKIVIISSNLFPSVATQPSSKLTSVVIILEAEQDTDGNRTIIRSYETLLESMRDQSKARDSKSESKSDNRSKPPFVSEEDRKDVKFCFKNATVLLALKPPTPIPSRPQSPGNNIEVSKLEEIEGKVEDISLQPISRPMTAKILVTVAEEPLIDYDNVASKIQLFAHRWYNNRHYASFKMQKFWKAMVIRRKWRTVVYDLMIHATKHIIVIQCIIRKFICQMKLVKMRKLHYRKLSQKTYLDLKRLLDKLDDCDLNETQQNEHNDRWIFRCRKSNNNNVSCNTSGCAWGSQILEVLELPDPPPGCVLPKDELLYFREDTSLKDKIKHELIGNIIDIDEFTSQVLTKKVSKSLITEIQLNKKVPTLYNTIAKLF
jgi:hypothetical protein